MWKGEEAVIGAPYYIKVKAAENGYIIEVRDRSDDPNDWEFESRTYIAKTTEECMDTVEDLIKELREEL